MARRIDAALIRRVGRPCTWERSRPSLGRLTTGHVDWTSGTQDRGYEYEDPVSFKAMFTSDSRNEPFNTAGSWEKGTCYMTFEADRPIKPQDRIVIKDSPIVELVKLTKGSGSTDTLPCKHVVDIYRLETKDATYTYGADFLINVATDGTSTIEWISATAPSTGEDYHFECSIYTTWIVQDHAKERFFGAGERNQLLKGCTLMRDDLAIRR